jgi:hypothetical protein
VARYNTSPAWTLGKGTVFKWEPFNEGYLDEEKEKLFRELESFLGERDARLVK